MIRIDKYLSQCTALSRSEIKQAVKAKRVRIGENIVKSSDVKIDPDEEQIYLDNRQVVYEKYVYYMLNKPGGVVSATKDNDDKTVIDLLKDCDRKDLFPVGRLDKDTEGLLLITNDGELAHNLLAPGKHVSKLYFAKIDGIVTTEDIESFNKGIVLADGTETKPATLNILSTDSINNQSEIEITIYEGKYHQVKRMFAAVGKHVDYLKRLQMGNLKLDDKLEPGEYKKITVDEILNGASDEGFFAD